MKHATALLVSVFMAATAGAQEDQFSTVITPAFSPITWERLVDARNEPNNWLMYSGTLDSQRYSLLDSIDTDNVGQLEMKWAYQIPVIDRAETVPLVVDGIMFITEAPSNVVAVDARTGREYWRYDHEMPDDLRICCGRNNRGVAILGETLFMSTLDAHLVAIDARTGNLLWDTEVAPHDSGYSKTAAPLIVKDKVVTGIAGGEFGIRGFIDAYDPATGEREWRTYVIPGPGEFGNDTWSDLDPLLTGTNAFVLIKGDVGGAVKAVQSFQKDSKKSELKGGLFEGRFLSQDDIKAIGDLPSKEGLMAQIAGSINALATKLAVGVNEVPSGLARALQQHADSENS